MPPKPKNKTSAPAEAEAIEIELAPIEEQVPTAELEIPVAVSEPEPTAEALTQPPVVAVTPVPVQPTGLKVVMPRRTHSCRVGGKYFQFVAGEQKKIPAELVQFFKSKGIV